MLVEARTVHLNPSPEELRSFTEEMPECRITEFGNVNVQTQVLSLAPAAHTWSRTPASER